jgi:hypothetical protein
MGLRRGVVGRELEAGVEVPPIGSGRNPRSSRYPSLKTVSTIVVPVTVSHVP